MNNILGKRLADTFQPSIRRESIDLSITDEAFNDGTLPDKGNHRQSSTLQCRSGRIYGNRYV